MVRRALHVSVVAVIVLLAGCNGACSGPSPTAAEQTSAPSVSYPPGVGESDDSR
ncbi:hypothetical protein [Halogeometricum limi]|uniref:hypothetical protein n=1 Tax=Halogeometricum limi TaxID=555875 RepID=UPI001587BC96|nr:hypothetical protein [Halogeometricum limi]